MSERDQQPTVLSSTNRTYPAAQVGTWTLTAPDGRQWTGKSPLDLAGQENAERIPAEERLRRIMDGAHGWGEEGIWLRSDHLGVDLTVLVEHDGQWVPVIRETSGGPISHIAEVGGINAAIKKARP